MTCITCYLVYISLLDNVKRLCFIVFCWVILGGRCVVSWVQACGLCNVECRRRML